jgi:hypothetical protein
MQPHWERLSRHNLFLWVCAECPECSDGCLKTSIPRPVKCYKEEHEESTVENRVNVRPKSLAVQFLSEELPIDFKVKTH